MTPVPVQGDGQPPAPPHVTQALPPALLPPSTPHPQGPDPGPGQCGRGVLLRRTEAFSPPRPSGQRADAGLVSPPPTLAWEWVNQGPSGSHLRCVLPPACAGVTYRRVRLPSPGHGLLPSSPCPVLFADPLGKVREERAFECTPL